MDPANQWPALLLDDDGLLSAIQTMLTNRVQGDPYSRDGSFAAALSSLPPGLRAMAATHFLDISLTLDSITWHFGNFGESALVAQTEEGLRELGLDGLAEVFCEARDLMVPAINEGMPEEGYDALLKRLGIEQRADEIERRGWDLRDSSENTSMIYGAWVRYARLHPDRVFGS